jgi:adenosylcobinamide-phosphate synthase
MRPQPAALLLAVALDSLAGEPRDSWHPVVWIGRAFDWAEQQVQNRTVGRGAVAVLAVTAAASGVAALVGALARRLGWLGVGIEALALKPAFAIRRLGAAAQEVREALETGRLEEARRLVGRHLVSRETAGLRVGEVTSAVVDSVAENLTDSVTAPLLAYAVGGLPAAWAYQALNTADAMWGYRSARYAQFGKAAARVDDAANLVPARLAAAALAGGATLTGADGRGAVRVAQRDHARTESPNAGWPMAAMAGALRVGLAKPGVYRLGDRPLPDSPDTIRCAVRVFTAASALVITAVVALALLRRETS